MGACCSGVPKSGTEIVPTKHLTHKARNSAAKPSARVTELLTRAENGSDANLLGFANKLPVMCAHQICR